MIDLSYAVSGSRTVVLAPSGGRSVTKFILRLNFVTEQLFKLIYITHGKINSLEAREDKSLHPTR